MSDWDFLDSAKKLVKDTAESWGFLDGAKPEVQAAPQAQNSVTLKLPEARPVDRSKPVPKKSTTTWDFLDGAKPEVTQNTQPEKVEPMSPMERVFSSMVSGAVHNQLGFSPAQRAYLKHIKGMSDEEISNYQKQQIAGVDRALAEDTAMKGQGLGDKAQRIVQDIAGNVLGGLDPTYFLAPGRTALQRIVAQALINGGADLSSQAIETERKYRDKIDPREVAISTVGGAIFQGAGEAVHGARLHKKIAELEGGGTLDNPKTSPAGAKGPMQVMDATARDPGFGIRPWDGKTEADRARVGRDYADALDKHYGGDTEKVLAAYNAGPGHIDDLIKEHGENWKEHLPQETKNHLARAGKGAVGTSVPPMDPKMLAKVMGEAPPGEAPDELLLDGRLKLPEDSKPPEDMNVTGPDESPMPPPDAQGPDAQAPQNVVDIGDLRKAREARDVSEVVGNLWDKVENLHHDVVENGKKVDINQTESMRSAINKELQSFDPSSDNHATLLDIDEMLKATIAHQGGKPRLYAPDASEKFMAGNPKTTAANENVDNINTGEGPPQGPPEEPPSGGGDGGDGEGPMVPPEIGSIIDRLTKVLNYASDKNFQLQRKMKQGRAEQFGRAKTAGQGLQGRARLHAELAAMRGELTSRDQPPLMHDLKPEEIDALINHIYDSNHLNDAESRTAGRALEHLLSEDIARIPTEGELDLLRRVFPTNFLDSLLKFRTPLDKAGNVFVNVMTIPRSMMSSIDMSAPFRQGILLIRHPEFWKAIPDMFKVALSEKKFNELQQEIMSRPTYDLMTKAGVSFTGLDRALSAREETFISEYAEILTGGKYSPIRSSARSYTAFLNKVRADYADKLIRMYNEAGVDLGRDPKALRAMGSLVNVSTGRGSFGPRTNAAMPFLATMLFSPRFQIARMQLFNPLWWKSLDPIARKEAVKNIMVTGALAATVIGMAKMAGADVETDLRSSDWGKIRVGNIRQDIMGGVQQYFHLGAMLAYGQEKGINDGKIKDLGDPDIYKSKTRLDTIWRFVQSKFAPVPAMISDELRGPDLAHPVDIVGQEHTPLGELGGHIAPMYPKDVYDAYQDSQGKGLLLTIPGFFGTSTQVFKPNQKKASKSTKSEWDSFNVDSSWSNKDWDSWDTK